MSGFDEYYNIKEIPAQVEDEINALAAEMKKKYPQWAGKIEIAKNSWPEGNAVRFDHGTLELNALSDIDESLQKILNKHKLGFELNSAGFTSLEED